MDVQKERFKLLAAQMIKNLEDRQMAGYYAEDRNEAREIALSLIPEGSVIGFGGSVTVKAAGLREAVVEKGFTVLDRHSGDRSLMEKRIIAEANCFITSTNAISEDGVLVNIDGTCNRIAAIAFGPENVIVLAGRNKVARDEMAAYERAMTVAAPINAANFNISTPCREGGSCEECTGPTCICRQVLTTRCSKNQRIKVILINEDLGF